MAIKSDVSWCHLSESGVITTLPIMRVQAARRAAIRCISIATLVTAFACGPDANPPQCNTCDGNVAIHCDRRNCDYYNPVRTDCGAKKCTVVNVDSQPQCTSQGAVFNEVLVSAECR